MIWFRMLWMMLLARVRPPVDILREHRLTYHCLPSDIDLNLHLTNSRFHAFMDQVRFDLMLRSGMWRRLRARRMGSVLGSSSIRFRRQVKPWQRFSVTARILSWDGRWIYMEHRLIAGTDTAALAIVKLAFVDDHGRVPPERFAAFMDPIGQPPPLVDLIAAKNAVDRLLAV
jgi:acyl-CoA thioesterase FadM